MYILNIEVLKVGDIILTGDDEKLSRIIKKHTKGNFSHAILYLGGSSYIHSDRDGVHSGNTQRLVFESCDNVKVLRLKEQKNINKAIYFARSQVGKEYSIKAAVNSKIKTNLLTGKNRQFCSKLVAQAYNTAGINLVGDPNFCMPKEIEDCSLLEVVHGATRSATKAEIEFSNTETPLNNQVIVTNAILKYFREISGRDIQSLNDLSNYIIENPKFDSQVSKKMKELGYFNLFDEEIIKNPWRYDYDSFIEFVHEEDKYNLAIQELKNSTEMIERFSYMLSFYVNAHKKRPLEYIELHIQLYRKLCEAMTLNQNVAKAVLAKFT